MRGFSEYFKENLVRIANEVKERMELCGGRAVKGRVSVNSMNVPTKPTPSLRPPNYVCNYPACTKPVGDHWTRQCAAWRNLTPVERGGMVVQITSLFSFFNLFK